MCLVFMHEGMIVESTTAPTLVSGHRFCIVSNVHIHNYVSHFLHRHSPFRSSNAKSKEEIDQQTLDKVNMCTTCM